MHHQSKLSCEFQPNIRTVGYLLASSPFQSAGLRHSCLQRLGSDWGQTGDEMEIVGGDQQGKTMKTTCTGVEMFKKMLDRGEAGGAPFALAHRRSVVPT